jgi:hypothetical protein
VPLYRRDSHLLPLASLLVPDRAIYYDAIIHLRLEDHPDDESLYNYRLSLTFTANLSEYVVGYVAGSQLTDVLLSGAQNLTDVYSFSTVEARDACYEKLCGSVDVVTLITTMQDGRTRHQALKLEPVPEADYESYLGIENELYSNSVRLLRAPIPHHSDQMVRLRVTQSFEQNKSDHFCYWVIDRPLYLRQLRADTRDFTPPETDRSGRLTLQPFMMATDAEISLRDGQVDVETENWLIRGQGFALIW